jgi:nucleoside-diphosphate-sugar epimerase
MDDGTAVNVGTMGADADVRRHEGGLGRNGLHRRDRASSGDADGPMSRVADNSLARRLPGWKPKVPFVEGLHHTIDWYLSTKDPEEVARRLDHALTER